MPESTIDATPFPDNIQEAPDLPRLPTFGNYHIEKVESGKDQNEKECQRIAHSMRRIDADLTMISPGWPKRVRDRLFVESDQGMPRYLNSPAKLLAWLDHHSHVDWARGPQFVTQERFYEHLRMHAEEFASIETMPHVPVFPGSYYMCRSFPEPSGKLEALLDRFNPATDIDRHLIASLILTPLWGGMPGARPAFLITGTDYDTEQGRGLGKTTLLDLVSGELYGGSIDVAANEDIGAIKTRLLSEQGGTKRIARLDNVKSLRFSWADLEGLITASEISGHVLYVGEGKRRNDLVWMITLNGASLSKDMAQRVVTIKLRRPEQTNKDWRESTVKFIQDHRWEILADAAAILSREPGSMVPATRWATWEREVLSKLQMADECRDEIVERQGAVDEGNSDRDLVHSAIFSAIKNHGGDPEEVAIKITSKTMAEIVSEATRKHYETNAATAFVKGLSIKELVYFRESSSRGWIWCGARANINANKDLPVPNLPMTPMTRR